MEISGEAVSVGNVSFADGLAEPANAANVAVHPRGPVGIALEARGIVSLTGFLGGAVATFLEDVYLASDASTPI